MLPSLHTPFRRADANLISEHSEWPILHLRCVRPACRAVSAWLAPPGACLCLLVCPPGRVRSLLVFVGAVTYVRERGTLEIINMPLKFGCLHHTVPLYNSKFGDLGSIYIGKYCTFVCGTLFPQINLIELYPSKQSSTYKSMTD
jgi:hypothetical protein